MGSEKFCRVMCVAYLISKGGYNNPLIVEATGLDRRKVQELINYLPSYTLDCVFSGSCKTGAYELVSWNGINRKWVKDNITDLWVRAGLSGKPPVGGQYQPG